LISSKAAARVVGESFARAENGPIGWGPCNNDCQMAQLNWLDSARAGDFEKKTTQYKRAPHLG